MDIKMTMKQMVLFIEVAKFRSISIAADRCFVTQPAASRTIGQLEKSLGYSLFKKKSGRIIGLTKNGQQLFEKSNKILQKVRSLEELSISETNMIGKLTIAATAVIYDYVLPEILAVFNKSHPNIKIEFKRDSATQIAQKVADLTYDLGFVDEEVNIKDNVESSLWREDFLDVICSVKNKNIQSDKITLDEVLNMPWVIWGSDFDAKDSARYNNSVVSPSVGYEAGNKIIPPQSNIIVFDNPEAVKNYVASSDEVVGCLSREVLKNVKTSEIRILKFPKKFQKRDFFILRTKEKESSYITDIFIKEVLSL